MPVEGALTRPRNRLPERFSLVETLLWRDGYPLLKLHLDRLEDSAGYFAFACDRAELKAALLAHARAFPSQEPRKVRLLLGPEGVPQIESEILPVHRGHGRASGARVHRTAAHRSSDRMLFHKTTHRPLYAKAFQRQFRLVLAMSCFSIFAAKSRRGPSAIFSSRRSRPMVQHHRRSADCWPVSSGVICWNQTVSDFYSLGEGNWFLSLG